MHDLMLERMLKCYIMAEMLAEEEDW